MAEYVKVNGVWKLLTTPYVKVAGAWKHASGIFVKSSGVWKSIGNPDTETTASPSSGLTGSSVTVSGDFSKVSITGVNFGGSPVTFTQTTSSVTFSVPSVGVGTYPIQLITGVTPELAPINFSVTGTGGGGIGVGVGVGIGVAPAISVGIGVAPAISVGIGVAPAIYTGGPPIYNIINTINFVSIYNISVGIASLNPPAILILNYGNFCINGDTKITVVNSDGSFSYKDARDIVEGDVVASLRFKEINPDAPAWDIYGWNDNTLTYESQKPTKVLNVYKSKHAKIMYFNKDETAKFSEEEPMLVLRGGLYEFYPSGTVDIGDVIFKYNEDKDTLEPILVEAIDYEEGDFDTYNYTLEEDHVLIAGGYIVHNK